MIKINCNEITTKGNETITNNYSSKNTTISLRKKIRYVKKIKESK